MDDGKSDTKSPVEALFDEARAQKSVDYVYTLVRVSGLTSGTRDSLLALRSTLQADTSRLSRDEMRELYCSRVTNSEPLTVGR